MDLLLVSQFPIGFVEEGIDCRLEMSQGEVTKDATPPALEDIRQQAIDLGRPVDSDELGELLANWGPR
jgi:hypothetical protein